MTERILSETEMMEKEEFERMAKAMHKFKASSDYPEFKSLFDFMYRVNTDMLNEIATKQSTPGSKTPSDIQALGLQAANISGQNFVIKALLEAPSKLIEQWDNFRKQKHIDEKKGE